MAPQTETEPGIMPDQFEIRPIAINWKGPFTLNDVLSKTGIEHGGLYQIYGHHPIFGFNTLYYVGQSVSFGDRMRAHQKDWVQWLSDSSCRLGYLDPAYYRADDNWRDWQELLNDVEKLTVYLHLPPANSEFITEYTGRPLQVYNWYDRGSLLMQYASHYRTAYPGGEWKKTVT